MYDARTISLVATAWVAAVAAALAVGGVAAGLRRKELLYSSLSAIGLLACLAPALGVDRQFREWGRALSPPPVQQSPSRYLPPPPEEPASETVTLPHLPDREGGESAEIADTPPGAPGEASGHSSGIAGWEDSRPLGPPNQRSKSAPAVRVNWKQLTLPPPREEHP